MSDNNFHFIPQIGKTFSSTGHIEPDIFDTTKAATDLNNLYDSIKNFNGEQKTGQLGSSSKLADQKLEFTSFGCNMVGLFDNSGTYGSLIYDMIIDYISLPSTLHYTNNKDSNIPAHNVYDEYRYSNVLTNQNCNVDILGTKEWTFLDKYGKKIDKFYENLTGKNFIAPQKLSVGEISYGGVPFSKIYNNIRNLEVKTSTYKGNNGNKGFAQTGFISIIGEQVVVDSKNSYNIDQLITKDYDPSHLTNTIFTTANDTFKAKDNIKLLGSTDTDYGRKVNILLNTGGFTSHSQKIKYWDSFTKKYIIIDRLKKYKDKPMFGPCSLYYTQNYAPVPMNLLILVIYQYLIVFT